jgi:actin-related protein 5
MFELYSVPSLTYAVDAVMSFYQNNRPTSPSTSFTASGLAISFNTSSTSVIPILDGEGHHEPSKTVRHTLRTEIASLELNQNHKNTVGISPSI